MLFKIKYHLVITSITLLFIIFISCILNPCVIALKMNEGDVCMADCTTTHTIVRDKRYFLDLTLINCQCEYHIWYCKLN